MAADFQISGPSDERKSMCSSWTLFYDVVQQLCWVSSDENPFSDDGAPFLIYYKQAQGWVGDTPSAQSHACVETQIPAVLS